MLFAFLQVHSQRAGKDQVRIVVFLRRATVAPSEVERVSERTRVACVRRSLVDQSERLQCFVPSSYTGCRGLAPAVNVKNALTPQPTWSPACSSSTAIRAYWRPVCPSAEVLFGRRIDCYLLRCCVRLAANQPSNDWQEGQSIS